MRTQQGDGGRPRANAYTKFMAVIFLLLGGINLLNREWVAAALFVLSGLVVLKGREVEGWPKAARYLVLLVLAALAVATFVRIILRLKAGV